MAVRHNSTVHSVTSELIGDLDGHIPKPLRWLAGIGLLPVPGPFDEGVLLIVGLLLLIFYRDPLREAWSQAAEPRVANRFVKPSRGAGDAATATGSRAASTRRCCRRR
jgi:hypothetical protein